VVWENGGQNGKTATADFLSGMSRTLPPMLQVLRDIAGVELPPSLVKLTEPADGAASADAAPSPAAAPAPAAARPAAPAAS
jgi:flotillin